MNSEFLTLNPQDLETLLNKGYCSCHFINPNKTRIILWKEVKNEVTTYYLRIGIQKFISYPLTDKNGEIYWRFNPWEVKVEESISPNPNNPITKYQQRIAKTEALNHGKSTSSSPATESTSQ
jgi:hypothetical protein